MQATNKSEFMGIVSIYLVRLTIVICSPSRYSGSNSCRPVVDDNIHIPVSSSTHTCLLTLGIHCYQISAPTVDKCANAAILFWQKGDSLVPSYVEEYFDLFREYLIAGSFKLPDQFCDDEALAITQIRSLHFYQLTSDCNASLENFNVHETRQNILQYAFYETKLYAYPENSIQQKYIRHISEGAQVQYQMTKPKKYCLDKFPLPAANN